MFKILKEKTAILERRAAIERVLTAINTEEVKTLQEALLNPDKIFDQGVTDALAYCEELGRKNNSLNEVSKSLKADKSHLIDRNATLHVKLSEKSPLQSVLARIDNNKNHSLCDMVNTSDPSKTISLAHESKGYSFAEGGTVSLTVFYQLIDNGKKQVVAFGGHTKGTETTKYKLLWVNPEVTCENGEPLLKGDWEIK